ncbi:putative Pol polyprotein [Cricetulus griseus]|nr:putative Pol polyprotein [Cricetulus griseus]
MDIITDPNCSKNMDPDMALESSLGPGGSNITQIIMTMAKPSDINMVSDDSDFALNMLRCHIQFGIVEIMLLLVITQIEGPNLLDDVEDASKTNIGPMDIDQHQKNKPMTSKKLEAPEQLVQEQLNAGHIEESTSPWNSSVFVIKKQSEKWRILTDLRVINKAWYCKPTMPVLGKADTRGLHSVLYKNRNFIGKHIWFLSSGLSINKTDDLKAPEGIKVIVAS